MMAHRLQRLHNISPVLGYRLVFGATLNVGQRHRRRANINPALVQRPGHCVRAWSTQVMTRTEWILVSHVRMQLRWCLLWPGMLGVQPENICSFLRPRISDPVQSLVTISVPIYISIAVERVASTGDTGPTFNRHWVGVGLYPPAVCIPANKIYWAGVGLMLVYRLRHETNTVSNVSC